MKAFPVSDGRQLHFQQVLVRSADAARVKAQRFCRFSHAMQRRALAADVGQITQAIDADVLTVVAQDHREAGGAAVSFRKLEERRIAAGTTRLVNGFFRRRCDRQLVNRRGGGFRDRLNFPHCRATVAGCYRDNRISEFSRGSDDAFELALLQTKYGRTVL